VLAAFSEEDERSVEIRLATKKMRGQPLSSDKERERLSRFIKSKGYSWEIVREALEYIDDRKRD
jgi:SOS response regulatory protein OraA/RecX